MRPIAGEQRPMRRHARRNHERLVEAAREVFGEPHQVVAGPLLAPPRGSEASPRPRTRRVAPATGQPMTVVIDGRAGEIDTTDADIRFASRRRPKGVARVTVAYCGDAALISPCRPSPATELAARVSGHAISSRR